MFLFVCVFFSVGLFGHMRCFLAYCVVSRLPWSPADCSMVLACTLCVCVCARVCVCVCVCVCVFFSLFGDFFW